jgi:hypothetical protein
MSRRCDHLVGPRPQKKAESLTDQTVNEFPSVLSDKLRV